MDTKLAEVSLHMDEDTSHVRIQRLPRQSNLLNEAGHPSTTVLPLTTQLIDDAAPLRYRVAARDELESDSDIMLDQTRTIDNRRITSDMLTILTKKELSEVEAYWRVVSGLD